VVPGGAFRYLVVGISIKHEPRTPEVQSLSFAGRPMAQLGGVTHQGRVRSELWGLTDPPEGMHLVSLRLTSPGGFVAGAVSFSGVHPTTSTGQFLSATGQSDLASVVVKSARGERVVDVYASDGPNLPAPGSSQLVHWAQRAMLIGVASSRPGDDDGSMSWQAGAGQAWALAAITLKPAGPAPDGGYRLESDGGMDGGTQGAPEAGVNGGTESDAAAGDGDTAMAAGDGETGEDDAGVPGDAGGAVRAIDLKVGCGCRLDASRATGAGLLWPGLLLYLVGAFRRRARTRPWQPPPRCPPPSA
jgi:hypothetical protein